MTYDDLLESSEWVQNMSASYFETLGAKVLVFKLDKTDTKLNPIYNEEINGRKYLRPFEIKAIYKTNPFDFNFDNTLPSETEGNLNFYFNFGVMANTMEALKGATSKLKITALEDGWSISKSGSCIYLENASEVFKFNTDDFATISELSDEIKERKIGDKTLFKTSFEGDDYSSCIPNFSSVKLANSVILKTFNSEFKNCGNTIEQGDLIYIVTLNSLYEVSSAFPVNNTIYRYVNWQCNAQRTFSYIEYEKLKKYAYGLNVIEAARPNA